MNKLLAYGGRYQVLEALGQGTMGMVYRVHDRLTKQTLALKAINTNFESKGGIGETSQEQVELRAALAREFRALASLRHPNIISVIDYGFEDSSPYFTMELLENKQDLITAANSLGYEGKLSLIKQILQALIYLHQRGFIHRDLKPANIQVVDKQAKILDFGLVIVRNDSKEKVTAGTLAYMSPEVIAGDIANESSDLYALGMMVYELIVGEYPFETHNVSVLLQQVLSKEIVLPDEFLDTPLDSFIQKLVSKNPNERYMTAREALNAAISLGLFPSESQSELIRESFLQTAPFVGREKETAELRTALAVLQEGKGSSWLIGGESGVGKSRLLDELRIQALIDGVLVLRGQEIEASNRPYNLLREPLRHLCLSDTLSDEDASIVQLLFPELAQDFLPDVAQEAASPRADTSFRLSVRHMLIEFMDRLFRRKGTAILLILEDLQWIKDSLPIVQSLVKLSQEIPLMVLASYRDDTRNDLAQSLSQMQVLKLERLNRKQIESLGSSIIGTNLGTDAPLLQLLERETEGNAFFIIEVIRLLAKRAGYLDQIVNVTLPANIYLGGVQSLIQQRLAHLPTDIIRLLKIAALAGRRIEPEILRIACKGAIDFDQWLLACDNAAVLEVADEEWQFSHDKIRTALTATMEEHEKAAMHSQLAEILKMLGDATKLPQYARIAFHQEQAGQLRPAINNYERAAELALRNYAIETTQEYLEQIDSIEQLLKASNKSSSNKPQEISHRARLWGEVTDAFGNLEGSRKHYEKVLASLSSLDTDNMTISKIPTKPKELGLSIAEQDLLFAGKRLLNICLFQGDWEQVKRICRQQVSLYYILGDKHEWIESQALEAWIDYFQGDFQAAERVFWRIYKLAKQKNLIKLLVFGGTGLIMNAIRQHLGQSVLEERIANLQVDIEALKETEAEFSLVLLEGVLAFAFWELGYLEKAREHAVSGLDAIREKKSFLLVEFAGLTGLAEMLLAETESSAETALELKYINQICKTLHIFAQVYPLARPRAWIYQGRENWLRSKHKQALEALEYAVQQSRQCNLPYDEGVAYLIMARLVKKDDQHYLAYLNSAIARFKEVNALNQLELALSMKAE